MNAPITSAVLDHAPEHALEAIASLPTWREAAEGMEFLAIAFACAAHDASMLTPTLWRWFAKSQQGWTYDGVLFTPTYRFALRGHGDNAFANSLRWSVETYTPEPEAPIGEVGLAMKHASGTVLPMTYAQSVQVKGEPTLDAQRAMNLIRAQVETNGIEMPDWGDIARAPNYWIVPEWDNLFDHVAATSHVARLTLERLRIQPQDVVATMYQQVGWMSGQILGSLNVGFPVYLEEPAPDTPETALTQSDMDWLSDVLSRL